MAVGFFEFQKFEETFCHSIVIRVPFGREGLHNIVAFKQPTEFFGSVLTAAIGMKQQTGRFPASLPCSLKRVDGEMDVYFGAGPGKQSPFVQTNR